MIDKIDLVDLNNKRLLVFIEDEEKPNEYHQIIFTQKHFKKVSDAVVEDFLKTTKGMRKDFEAISITQSEKSYKLPDEFSDFE